MTNRFRCAHRWPQALVIAGLALLVIGVVSFFQHEKVSSGSVRLVRAADTPKDSGDDQARATLADVAGFVAALFRTDETSRDPAPIDDRRPAEPMGAESEPPAAVKEAPTDPQRGSVSPAPLRGNPAAAAPAPIVAGNDPIAQAPMPEPVAPGGDFGTAVTFARSPTEAAKLAKRDKKLAFFLHVSGNFEDSGFT